MPPIGVTSVWSSTLPISFDPEGCCEIAARRDCAAGSCRVCAGEGADRHGAGLCKSVRTESSVQSCRHPMDEVDREGIGRTIADSALLVGIAAVLRALTDGVATQRG